jgi:dual specificity tyrosine-phosphorylation-regulated kinase 2/3/4
LKFPSSPAEILNFSPDLPAWCRSELLSFEEIFYFCKETKGINREFDDDKGDYKVLINDDILYRFEVQDILGKGSFGQVLKVFDHLTKKTCALKIIKNKQRYQDQAKIEIEILMLFKQGCSERINYIVQMQEHFLFRGHTVLDS